MALPEIATLQQVGALLAWLIAIVGGLIAAFRAVSEMKLTREQRAHDLAWQQAKEAFAMTDRIGSDGALRTATLMLDYDSRNFVMPSGQESVITRAKVMEGLRLTNLRFDEEEVFIRDTFDQFFSYLDRIEIAIEVGLVRKKDIIPLVDYYADLMNRNQSAFASFMSRYGYRRALDLLQMTPSWGGATQRSPDASQKKA